MSSDPLSSETALAAAETATRSATAGSATAGSAKAGASTAGLDLDPELWQGLFSLAKKEADDRRALERHLRRWCGAQGDVDAALYCRIDEVYHQRAQVVAGSGPEGTSFPEEIRREELDSAQGGPWSWVELPEGLLLYAPSSEAPALDPGRMLLAAGARISALKRQIQEQSFQAMFRGVELEARYDVGLAIASTLDLEELHEEVLLRPSRCSTPAAAPSICSKTATTG